MLILELSHIQEKTYRAFIGRHNLLNYSYRDYLHMLQQSFLQEMTQSQRELFDSYAKLLQEENKRLNLTRITEIEEIRQRHFEDSLVVLPLLRKFQADLDHTPSLIDIGSGGGFPILALAIALPEWSFTSVEATGKKVAFQNLVVNELGLGNVEVIQARAEDLSGEFDFREMFDVATNRAVGVLSMVAELCVPFIRRKGLFLTWKGPKLSQEIDSGKKALHILGCSDVEELPYTLCGEDPAKSGYRLLKATKRSHTPGEYPRAFKDIKSNPLGK